MLAFSVVNSDDAYLPQGALWRAWGYRGRASPGSEGDGGTLLLTGRSYKTKMKHMGKPHEDSEQKVVGS